MTARMVKLDDSAPSLVWRFWEKLYAVGVGLYDYFLRASLKWFLHVFTGRCELERLLTSLPRGGTRCVAVERSLLKSKRPDLRQCLSIPVEAVPSLVALITKVKYVSAKEKRDFEPRLRDDLCAILGYAELCREVEWARKTAYDSGNPEHERLLLELWGLMMPGQALSARKSRDWQEIGFQGSDPATDFRGMGVLGLEQLVFLFASEEAAARRLFALSRHPVVGFPFAIAGISLTAMLRDWLRSGALKPHIFSVVRGAPSLEHFHVLYAQVFQLFVAHWQDWGPASIMEFNAAKAAFEADMLAVLGASADATLPEPTSLKDQPS